MEKFWREFDEILERHGHAAAGEAKRISIGTYHLRRKRLVCELHKLRSGKLVRIENGQLVPEERRFKLKSPRNLRSKHIEALIADWLARGLSVAYVHNVLSVFRVFCVWIGKAGMVPPTEKIIRDPRYQRRKMVATQDTTWKGCGLDPAQVLPKMAQQYPRVALALEIMLIFGLRLKEASLLRPHLADQETYLDVNRGTKGGRDRTHKITRSEERDVLERVKKLVDDRNACLIPSDKTYRSWMNHVYYVLHRHGVSRKQCGTSTHGLRRQALNDEYRDTTGFLSPVQGGKPGEVSQEMDRFARQQVAEKAGHCRRQISSAYLGGVLRPKKKQLEDQQDEIGPVEAEQPATNSDADPSKEPDSNGNGGI